MILHICPAWQVYSLKIVLKTVIQLINLFYSKIPLTSRKSTKLNKARPVPDFGKMHRKWADTLEKGKACVKKPCTVVS